MYVAAGTNPVIAIDARGQIYLLEGSVTLRATEENGFLVLYASQ
jgi:hypothetical protein